MDIDQIRRDAFSLWLRGIRLPLTAAEATVKRGQDATSWQPALAFRRPGRHQGLRRRHRARRHTDRRSQPSAG